MVHNCTRPTACPGGRAVRVLGAEIGCRQVNLTLVRRSPAVYCSAVLALAYDGCCVNLPGSVYLPS